MNHDKLAGILVLLLGAGVGCASTNVGPGDDLSADQHEQAAQQDRDSARAMADRYDGKAVRMTDLYPEKPATCDPSLRGSCSPFWTMTKNPTDRELSLAAAFQARARRHRRAAAALRDAEARACTLVSLADQDMSPLLRQRDIRGVEPIKSDGRGPVGAPAGAAITFGAVADLTEQNLQRIVDCQLARNAALAWNQADNASCPLNVKGAKARVRTVGKHLTVEVTSTDAAAALEILARARALVPGPPVSAR